jgi:pyridinium-3,5-bisthiocarboxylic acid mononucleotide nickel chelatase
MTPPPGYDTDTVIRLEANLDDLSPEITGAAMEKLLAAGALDVWLTPVQMKKNRPGTLLSVLCDEAHLAPMTDLIFRETSTFGLRVEHLIRLKLDRRFQTVATEFGDVIVKLGLRGDEVIQRAPEFESCKAVAAASGQPLRVIYEAALRAARR